MTRAVTVQPLKFVQAASPAERARAALLEAKTLASDHIGQSVDLATELERLLIEIAAGGETYHPGVRDIARRMANGLRADIDRITTIMERQ